MNGPSELSDEEKTRKPRETNAAAKNERTNERTAVKVSFIHFFLHLDDDHDDLSFSFLDDIYDYGILSHFHRVVAQLHCSSIGIRGTSHISHARCFF